MESGSSLPHYITVCYIGHRE